MRFYSTKAIGIATITLAALATSACGGGNKAANNAAAAIPMNTSFGNDASAMESVGTPTTNSLPELPPVAEPTTRNSAVPAGNASSTRDTPPSTGTGRVESNISGM